MPTIISILFSLVLALPLFASDRVGNGGFVVSYIYNNAIVVKTLDVLEAGKVELKKPLIQYDEMDIVEELLSTLKRLDPARYDRLVDLSVRFFQEVEWGDLLAKRVRPKDWGVFRVSNLIDQDATLILAVAQNHPDLPLNKYYLVDEEIWRVLSVIDRAALILHEVIYRDLLSQAGRPANGILQNSIPARALTAALLNGKIRRLKRFSDLIDFYRQEKIR